MKLVLLIVARGKKGIINENLAQVNRPQSNESNGMTGLVPLQKPFLNPVDIVN